MSNYFETLDQLEEVGSIGATAGALMGGTAGAYIGKKYFNSKYAGMAVGAGLGMVAGAATETFLTLRYSLTVLDGNFKRYSKDIISMTKKGFYEIGNEGGETGKLLVNIIKTFDNAIGVVNKVLGLIVKLGSALSGSVIRKSINILKKTLVNVSAHYDVYKETITDIGKNPNYSSEEKKQLISAVLPYLNFYEKLVAIIRLLIQKLYQQL